MIDALILLLKPALRAADGGSRNPLDILAALTAWPLDMLIAHTTWAAMYGWPQKGEWTISHTLERLCAPENAAHEDYWWLVQTAKKINRASPTGRHIKIIS
jgi:hypothetical protein